MIRSPCLHCDQRHLLCHVPCRDYKEWKAELAERKKKEQILVTEAALRRMKKKDRKWGRKAADEIY